MSCSREFPAPEPKPEPEAEAEDPSFWYDYPRSLAKLRPVRFSPSSDGLKLDEESR